MKQTQSGAWFARAVRVTPGGVNSPARSFRSVGQDCPVVMRSGSGAYLTDVDGNQYVDYLAAFGPLVLGHNHPRVAEATRQALQEGPLMGTPCPSEIELAETLVGAIEGLEQVRLTSTGTEAVMSAVRLARAFTGRSLIVKFDGAYHGHSDAMLVQAGSGAASAGAGDSWGVPAGVTGDVMSLPFNDVEALAAAMDRWGDRVAAILTEPVVGNMGIVPPRPGYLETLRDIAHRAGALLIFDEVITAFRFHYGAAASLLGVIPDLYALGKIIGGGLNAGAYGGRRDIMQYVAPLGGMFQAGTLAGNPLSSAAGLATLNVLRTESPYGRMDRLARQLADGLVDLAGRAGVPVTVNRVGSALTLFFGADPVTDYETARRADVGRFARFYRRMLAEGIYLAPSRFEAWFVSAAHTAEDIERTLTAAAKAFAEVAQAG